MKKIFNFICKHYQTILIVLFFLIVSHFFIYSGDDWFWSSSDAIKLLKNGFRYYNGRYVSNVIAMLITRNFEIKCICYAIISPLLFIVIKNLVNKDENKIVVLSLLLFMFIGYDVLKQGFVWTSGYVNFYISSIFLLVLIKLVDDNKLSNINKYISLLIALAMSLFLENVSIAILLYNIFLIIYSKVKGEKLYNVHFIVGNAIGTILILINPIIFPYHENREIIYGGMVDNFVNKIVPYYCNNSVLIILILIVCLMFYFNKICKKNNKELIIFNVISYTYFMGAMCSAVISNYLNTIFIFIYTFYTLYMVFKYWEEKSRFRVISYILFKIFYIAPLLVTHVGGGRLVMFPIIIDIVIIMEVLNYFKTFDKINRFVNVFLLLFVFSSQIVVFIYRYNKAMYFYEFYNKGIEDNREYMEVYDGFNDQLYHFFIPDKNNFKYYVEYFDLKTSLKKPTLLYLKREN